MRRGASWLLMAGILIFGQAAAAQAPSKDQQKCLKTLGKGTLKVSKTQAGENKSCIKGLAKGKLVGTADACLQADARGKIAKAQAKNLGVEASRCVDAAVPAFGSGGAAAANAAAQQAGLDLAHDLFGDPIDSGLASCDPDKSACTCQAKVLKGVDKQIKTLAKTHAACKKKRFKLGSIVADSDLEGCLDDALEPLSVSADTKGKLAKGRAKLASQIVKSCDGPGVSTTAFPGDCSGLAGAALAGCLSDVAECRFCQMTNAAEEIFADCDVFDDATANGSCELLSCPTGQNACPVVGCTNLDSDDANCGICGMVCGMGQSCTGGLCL